MSILDKILEKECSRLANVEDGVAELDLLQQQVAALRAASSTNTDTGDMGRFRVVHSETELLAMIDNLSSANVLTFDIETTGINPWTDNIVGLGLCSCGGHGYYVPTGHDDGAGQIDRDRALEVLRPLLTSKGVVAHNAKFEYMFMKLRGVELSVAFDTMLACQLLDENTSPALKNAAPRLLDVADWGIDLEKRPANKRLIREVAAYCVRDCIFTHQLYEMLAPVMEADFDFVFHEVEMPLVPAMAEMELAGLPVDVGLLREIGENVSDRRAELIEEIHESAGREFNINSAPQLSTILFEELKLPVTERTPTGSPSTGAEALEKIGTATHPIIAKLLEYKGFEKLQSSYLKPVISPKTGRVHASYRQIGTETGRMTGSGSFHPLTFPNDGVHPVSLRKAVGGVPEFHIVCADFKSQEPADTAAYSGDEAYSAPFAEGESSHGHVARMMFGLQEGPNEIKSKLPEQYAIAKTINLGLVYGMSEYALAPKLTKALKREVALIEAAELIEKFFQTFPGVKTWLDTVIGHARRDGHVTDMAGRRRRLPVLREKMRKGDKDLYKRQKAAEREATNFMVQAVAASQTKRAMVRCHQQFRSHHPETQIIAARHDELMFLVPDDELNPVCSMIKEAMENDPELGKRGMTVKPEVEITCGPNWSAAAQMEWKGQK